MTKLGGGVLDGFGVVSGGTAWLLECVSEDGVCYRVGLIQQAWAIPRGRISGDFPIDFTRAWQP